MFIIASTFARTGVIALGVLTAFGGMAMTAPLGRIDRPALPMSANLPIELAQGDHIIRRLPRGGVRGGVNRGWRGGGNWNGNRAWRGSGNWRGNRGWKGRHWNYGNRHYHDYDDDNVGIVTGLGGYGLYPGYYPGYYGGYYPRRYYGSGNAHESWCYSRYRSYRALDNTYQPYYGPRRECNSPYG